MTSRSIYTDLIETLWNVKDGLRIQRSRESIDLIETLWNVKDHRSEDQKRSRFDLIETLWNVKSVETGKNNNVNLRFNRDIVECKVSLIASSFQSFGI